MNEPRASMRAHADFDIRSPLRGYFRIIHDVLVEPETFFQTVRGGSLRGPTLFVCVTGALVSVLVSPFVLLGLVLALSRIAQLQPEQMDSLWRIVAFSIAVLVLPPFIGILASLFATLAWHPVVALSVGIGRGSGFRETYRICAYLSVFYVVGQLVPLIGPIAALAVLAYAGVGGVKGAHETTRKRARISVLIPLLLILLFFFLAIFVVSYAKSPAGF